MSGCQRLGGYHSHLIARLLIGLILLSFVISACGDSTPTAIVGPTEIESTPHPIAESTQISPVDGMALSYIPAGTFQMGSESGKRIEQPVHNVTLDAFWMDQTEVTNAMYARCVADGACSPPDSDDSRMRGSYNPNAADNPVIYVDWNQAAAYCTWAGRELPTEAQWEYAARGGLAGALYPWGNESPSQSPGAQNWAWYSRTDITAVARFAPNGYGLYDMAGNVWEWVADWYGPYASETVENPTGPSSGDYRVLRGGSFSTKVGDLRVSNRLSYNPVLTTSSFGFRCSLTP